MNSPPFHFRQLWQANGKRCFSMKVDRGKMFDSSFPHTDTSSRLVVFPCATCRIASSTSRLKKSTHLFASSSRRLVGSIRWLASSTRRFTNLTHP